MTFAAPWALCALLLLPVIWWWARRRMQPLIVPLPSLMFLMDEDERLHAPRKRVLDWETRVALVALTALILAAAGPGWASEDAGRRVRVLRATTGPNQAARDGGARRVDAALAAIRAELAPEDELSVVDLPREEWGRPQDPPPAWDAIYASARRAEADLRVVLVDALPDDPPEDLTFVGVGSRAARNLAWVSAAYVPTNEGPVLHAVLRNQGAEPTRATVRWGDAAGREMTLPAGAHQALRLPARVVRGEARTLTVTASDERADERGRDNAVVLVLRPLRLGFAGGLPDEHKAAVRDCLIAALTPLGVVEPESGPFDFFVGVAAAPPAAGRVRLLLEPLPPGEVGRVAPPGLLAGPTDARTADLRRTGARFVFRAGANALRDGERALLEVGAGSARTPVLAVGRDGVLRLAADPLAGSPAPADTAFLPLLCGNLLGTVGAVGLERRGLEDPARSLIGPYDQPFDPARLRGARNGKAAEALGLRRPLIALAALLLLLLWWLPGRLEARARA